jgi:Galactose oxidase, central domain
MTTIRVLLLTGALLPAAATACGDAAGPPADTTLLARRSHTLVYDAARHRMLLFGGIGPAEAGGAEADRASLWSFDGSAWSLLSSGGGPSSRNSMAAAFDAGRGRLLVFGGRTGSAPTSPALGDAWMWDGTTWSQGPAGAPSSRFHAAAGYDAARQRIILIGGFDPLTGQELTDQYDFLGTGWTSLAGSVPGGGFGPILVSDGTGLLLMQSRVADRVVEVYRMTSPGQWQLASDNGPVSSGFAVATLPGGGVLLFGGSDGTSLLAETWTWDGDSWTKLDVTGPPARVGHAMALDAARGRIVLFGGETSSQTLADTWEFNGQAWSRS